MLFIAIRRDMRLLATTRISLYACPIDETFDELAKYVGEFHSEELQTTFIVDIVEGKLRLRNKNRHLVQLHQKQGGQIRTDYQYPSGDILVWYPMQRQYEDVATPVLGEQFRQFGQLLDV